MSLKNPNFIKFSKDLFSANGANWDDLVKKLSELESKKMHKITHFYYFICNPEDRVIRDELVIVGITSIMEALMQDCEYTDVFSYFESTYRGQNKIKDFKKFKEEYLDKYGTSKKVKSYISTYLSQVDAEQLVSSISIWDNKKEDFVELKNINKFSEFLYCMRSEFVHTAKMVFLNPSGCSFSVIKVGRSISKIKLNIKELKNIFERSFVQYWKERSRCC